LRTYLAFGELTNICLPLAMTLHNDGSEISGEHMNPSGLERRRLPRVAVPNDRGIVLKMSIPVQILEVSRGGVQLVSRSELAVGDRADLLATIDGESFSVAVEIRHVSIDPQPRGGIAYRAGAVFAPAAARERLLLDRLLGTESR